VITFALYDLVDPTNDTVISLMEVPKLVPVMVNNPRYKGVVELNSRLITSILLDESIVYDVESVIVYPLNAKLIPPVLDAGAITTIY
jgi:hypothetical protein